MNGEGGADRTDETRKNSMRFHRRKKREEAKRRRKKKDNTKRYKLIVSRDKLLSIIDMIELINNLTFFLSIRKKKKKTMFEIFSISRISFASSYQLSNYAHFLYSLNLAETVAINLNTTRLQYYIFQAIFLMFITRYLR